MATSEEIYTLDEISTLRGDDYDCLENYFAIVSGTYIYCLHCGRSFMAGDEVFDSEGLMECPIEGCDGSPMDWSLTPWDSPAPDAVEGWSPY